MVKSGDGEKENSASRSRLRCEESARWTCDHAATQAVLVFRVGWSHESQERFLAVNWLVLMLSCPFQGSR